MASQNNPLLDTQAEVALKSQVTPGGNSAAGVGGTGRSPGASTFLSSLISGCTREKQKLRGR